MEGDQLVFGGDDLGDSIFEAALAFSASFLPFGVPSWLKPFLSCNWLAFFHKRFSLFESITDGRCHIKIRTVARLKQPMVLDAFKDKATRDVGLKGPGMQKLYRNCVKHE